MVSFINAFIGTQQSKYAAVAILIALTAIVLSILLGADKIPFGQKVLFALLILLISLPSVLYTLFQMSCIVTGASGNRGNWWCGAFAWVLVVLVIIYTILIVVISIMSIVQKKNMIEMEEFYSNKEMYENAAREFIKEEKKDQESEEAFIIRGGASEAYEIPTMPLMTPTTDGVEAFENSVFAGTALDIKEAIKPVPKKVAMPQ
jgi:membrane protein implicated in regulation of membrane protease activity